MGNLFYDYGSKRPPLWVLLVFRSAWVIRAIRWFVVQFWKTTIWLPLAVRKIRAGGLGPDASRILFGSIAATILFELLVLGMFVFAPAQSLEVWVAVALGVLVYFLLGIQARCAARHYDMLT